MHDARILHSRHPFPEIIQTSWQRCRDRGMSSRLHLVQTPLSTAELLRQQEHNHQLRRLALREMHLLEHTLADTGRILLLANSNGVILDSQGDTTFLGRARKVFLVPGASWQEQVMGTNAIGTAIVERRFMQVIGAEHFVDENRFLACNAMPIMSPTARLAGVLNISGNECETFSSSGRLVRHAVAHIEHDWVLEVATDLVVRLHQHPSWLGTPEEGVLGFHDGLLTAASSRALNYLGLGTLAIGAIHWDDIFYKRPSLGRQELQLHASGLYYADVTRASYASARIAATEPSHAEPETETLSLLQDEALRRAVITAKGNLSAAARKLGIHRSTLYRRLARRGFPAERSSSSVV